MSWNKFKTRTLYLDKLDILLDTSRMNYADGFFKKKEKDMKQAFADMKVLEKGGIANPDEQRMVGHYWLRNSKLAPKKALREEIDKNLKKIHSFARAIHQGKIKGQKGKFENILIIGIGGSALGPQFVSQALGCPKKDKMRTFFFDNTDPDGLDLTLAHLQGKLGKTLCIVTSKSGGTPETRNGMLEAEAAYKKAGLKFEKHAVATTGEGSTLYKHATENNWIDTFPMWDWVGGRTSELAAVGLLPAALQGIDINGMLEGAKQMDSYTRLTQTGKNPAAILALMWHHATGGKGKKDMVILPYKDRLMLLSKYLQQLVMESLGKERNLKGKIVNQGIAVYGNKGSTDQHAYVQQLREGVPNFFATFIEVKKDRSSKAVMIEKATTSGDYLKGFLLGTRDALYEKKRESITITVPEVSAHVVGQLIALYERAVSFYGSLVGINAYHQPGVEAGKAAAAGVLELKNAVHNALKENKGKWFTADKLAKKLKATNSTEHIFKLLEHMAANSEKKVHKRAKKLFYNSEYSFK